MNFKNKTCKGRLRQHINRYLSILKTINSFSRKYVFITIVIKVFALGNSYLLLYMNKLIINELTDVIFSKSLSIQSILCLLILSGIVEVLSSLLFNVLQYNLGKLKLKYDDEIALKLAISFSKLDMSYYDDPESYNKTLHAGKCRSAILDSYNGLLNLFFELLAFVIAFVVAVRFSVWVLILALISVFPGMIVRRKIQTYQYNVEKQLLSKQRRAENLLALFYLRHAEMEMQLYGFGDYIKDQVSECQREIRDIRINTSLKKAKLEGGISVLDKVFYIVQQVIMAVAIVNRGLSIGDFTYYGGIISKLTASTTNLVNTINALHLSNIKYDEYISIISRKPKIFVDGKKTVEVKDVNIIEFDNVSFRYPNTEQNALSNVSFKLLLGDKIALVGPNGAGKSTLIKLLLRFYDPTEGRILLNGIDIKEYDLPSYRKLFATMFQEVTLYLMSVKDNVIISDVDLPLKEAECRVEKILSDLNLKFLNGEEIDINKFCGKEFYSDGYVFSVGQKQRLHAARTLFHDGAVFILDEPAASMDAISEKEFLNTLVAYTTNKSVIYITHRYNNLHMMDNILVLSHGALVESGKHEALIAKNGLYSQMFKLQKENK